MKKLLLLISLIFFTACAVEVLNETNQTTAEIPFIPVNVTNTTVEEEGPQPVANEQIIKKEINGTMHTIEVIDVDEEGKSCILKVDGFTDLLDEGETKRVNGVLIHVLEVRVMRSITADEDLCKLIIG